MEALEEGETYEIKDAEENVVLEVSPKNAFTMLVVSAEGLSEDGQYTLWLGHTQLNETKNEDEI